MVISKNIGKNTLFFAFFVIFHPFLINFLMISRNYIKFYLFYFAEKDKLIFGCCNVSLSNFYLIRQNIFEIFAFII